MFDCIMPTRNGRNGQIFTKQGVMNMRNERWKNDFSPIEEDGASFVDTCTAKPICDISSMSTRYWDYKLHLSQLGFLYMAGTGGKETYHRGDFSEWKPIDTRKCNQKIMSNIEFLKLKRLDRYIIKKFWVLISL
jgi:queuine tRNA-ribosyltransferase